MIGALSDEYMTVPGDYNYKELRNVETPRDKWDVSDSSKFGGGKTALWYQLNKKMLKTVIRRMKLSNNLGEFLKKLTLLHLRPIALAKKSVTDSAIRRLMVAAGDDIDDLMILCRADITTKNPNKVNKYMKNFERVDEKMKDVKERDLFSQFQSPIRGKEIMEICNLDEGKKIGEIKKAIEEAILDGKIDNDHDNALTYLYQIKDDYIS